MLDYLRNLGKSDDEKRQEALHAYVSGELSGSDRRDFEQQLNSDPALRAEVEQLQGLKASMRALPRRRVPRSFALDGALYGKPAPNHLGRAYPALRTATAFAALMIVFALGWGFLNLGFGSAGMDSSAEPAQIAVQAPISETAIVMESESALDITAQETAEESEEELLEFDIAEEEVEEAMEEAVEESFDEALSDDAASDDAADTAMVAEEEAAADEESADGEMASGAAPEADEAVATLETEVAKVPTAEAQTMNEMDTMDMDAPESPPDEIDSTATGQRAVGISPLPVFLGLVALFVVLFGLTLMARRQR